MPPSKTDRALNAGTLAVIIALILDLFVNWTAWVDARLREKKWQEDMANVRD